jgi:hypothetical protein
MNASRAGVAKNQRFRSSFASVDRVVADFYKPEGFTLFFVWVMRGCGRNTVRADAVFSRTQSPHLPACRARDIRAQYPTLHCNVKAQ